MKKYTLLLTVFMLTASWAVATTAQAGLDFYKKELSHFPVENSREQRAYASTLANGLETWLRQYPTNPEVQDALLMQTRLYLRAQEPGAAIVTLFKLRHQFPAVSLNVLQPLLTEAVQQGLDSAYRNQALQLFSAPLSSQTETVSQRKAEALYQLSKLAGKSFYEPAQLAFENFFVQYPTEEQNNEIELWYGDLHRLNGNYLAAIAQYRKASQLYPNTPYKAASLRLIGDIYADNLKDTAAATEMYTRVLNEFPDSSEIGTVYKHMAILDENNKQYESALINYDKAIELLGTTPAAFEAYTGKADVLEKNQDFQGAYDLLIKTGGLFTANPSQSSAAYEKAARVANKRLKDQARYTQALEKALLAFPNNSKGAELMYDLAKSYEKQGKNTQALSTYKKLVLKYPTDKYASKAQGRISRLSK